MACALLMGRVHPATCFITTTPLLWSLIASSIFYLWLRREGTAPAEASNIFRNHTRGRGQASWPAKSHALNNDHKQPNYQCSNY